MVKDFTIKIKRNGKWSEISIKNNFQRLVHVPINAEIDGVAFCGLETHGAETIRLFSIDIMK